MLCINYFTNYIFFSNSRNTLDISNTIEEEPSSSIGPNTIHSKYPMDLYN